jgi:hypothetical protein
MPSRVLPANETFALFLLVRQISILSPFVDGSHDFFLSHFFNEVFIFNEENISEQGEIEGLSV